MLTKSNHWIVLIISIEEPTRMLEETEGYWWNNGNVLNPMSLYMSEELQDLELFHDYGRDTFEQRYH